MPSPLTSLRILDLSRLLPGPYTTRLLADLGADVIKIETPLLGDYARDAPPEFGGSAMFDMLNRGKQSLALNYRNKQGREIFLKLAETADLIVETFKPGSMDKWGLGYETVKAINPRLIYCSLSGYGQTGPYATRPGHDLNYIAIGGLLGLTGTPENGPAIPGAQIADLGGATFATLHVLAALLHRAQTGAGQYIDVAMIDPIVHWLLPTAGSAYFGTGQAPVSGHMPLTGGWPCNHLYPTADGRHLTLGAIEPPFWSEFCRLTERNDLLPSAFDPAHTFTLTEIFLQKTADEWLALFDGVDCPLELVLTLPETLQHPQVVHRGLVSPLRDPRGAGGEVARLASLFPYPTREGTAPSLGRDTRAVLASAGYSLEEIEQFAEKRIIKLADSTMQ